MRGSDPENCAALHVAQAGIGRCAVSRLPRDDICPMGNVASFRNRGYAAVKSLSGFRFVPVRADLSLIGDQQFPVFTNREFAPKPLSSHAFFDPIATWAVSGLRKFPVNSL
jgi:hypothetical protein